MRVALLLLAALTGVVLAAEAPLFSGKTELYEDKVNGFKVVLPVEFKLQDKGLQTWWNGPATGSVHVTVVPMPGVASNTLYQVNLKTYKENKAYTDVTPVKVKLGGSTVPGLTFRESTTVQGTTSTKGAEDIHRWHLMAFGNNRQYNVLFGGQYGSFSQGPLPAEFQKIIPSFELLPVK